MKQNHQRIHGDNQSFEYYTPAWIMERVRATLGGIDYDPASCDVANERLVRAKRYATSKGYTEHRIRGEVYRVYDWGGLKENWRGNVWLNHPFGKGKKECKDHCNKPKCKVRGYHLMFDTPGSYDWIYSLVYQYRAGRSSYRVSNDVLRTAATITFANTDTAWFKLLLPYPQVYLYKRVNFMALQDGELVETRGVSKGAVMTFLGVEPDVIYDNWHDVGELKLSYRR